MKKLITKLLVLVFVVAIFVAWTPKSYAAERFKYTFKTESGETYQVIANVNGLDVEIVGAPYNLITESSSGNLASGNSYYNTITGDYESTYNGLDDNPTYTQAQITNKMKNRAKDVLRLLQFFINAQETADADTTTITIKVGDNTLISGRGATYAYGKVGTQSFDRIISNVGSNVKTNPFAIVTNVEPPTYNSDYIKFKDFKLKEYYDDALLIAFYEKALQKPDWITKEETTESQITVNGYAIQVDKSMLDTTGEIFIKVVDSVGTEEYASFLLAEKQRVGSKCREITYTNETRRKIKWFENLGKKGLTTGTSGVNENTLLYYQSVNGQRRTLEYYSNGNKLDLDGRTAFVAVRNSDSRSVFVYSVKNENNIQVTTLLGTVNIDSIGEDLSLGSIAVNTGNWVLDKTGTKIMIYRENETDPDNNCYYVDLNNMYNCYTKQGSTFDIALPVQIGINGNFKNEWDNTPGAYVAFISTSKALTKNANTDPMILFENNYLDNKVPMYITIAQVPEQNENDGTSTDKKVDTTKLIVYPRTSELPPKLTFKEIIKEEDTRQAIGRRTTNNTGSSRIGGTRTNDGLSGGSAHVTEEDTVTFTEVFLADTVNVGKNILMILIFCALVAAGFRHALKGATDAKEREKTKVTLKNILVGILIFISLSLIVTLIWDFTYKGLDIIHGSVSEQLEQAFENEDQVTRTSLILDIIEVILKVVNEIEAGLIEIFAKTLTGDATLSVTSTALHEATDSSAFTKEAGINYISLIYNVYTPSGQISSMMPFDAAGVEWSRLLAGYNMLMSVAFTVMLFAIVITACQYVMFAGNPKKITAVKQRLIRMFWAALLLITVPYLVQFLLFIFNYLTAAVPVNWDDPKFEIDIAFDGVLGEVARNVFLTTQCNIYMAFLVRHVMLSILLVSGPLVIIAWAIYERFRSFPVWFGELFTNIAMQFCYAVGFMAVIFLSYEGQNPVYGLILVSVSLGLSKFIKESLQGYFQEWGGIDEEGTAGSIVKMAFGWTKKAKKEVKHLGNILEKGSKRIDSDQVTKTGVAASNIGKVLQGNWANVTTKRQRYKNIENRAKKLSRTDTDENDKRKNVSGQKLEDQQQEAQEAFDRYMDDPTVAQEDKDAVMSYLAKAENDNVKVIKTGKGYDEANTLARADKNLRREEARKHMHKVNEDFDRKADDTILNRGIEETRDKAMNNYIDAGDQQLIELGREAVAIKNQVPPEQVVQKLDEKHHEAEIILAQLAATDDANEKEKKINQAEELIMTLAIFDAKGNNAKMQQEVAELVGRISVYKAEKIRNAGIKVSDNQIKALEEALLMKSYKNQNEEQE